MKTTKHRHKVPPPDSGSVYIEPKKSAATFKGGAALFYSTGIYEFPDKDIFTYIITYFLCAAFFFKPPIFLFKRRMDKPCTRRPCCRSPPHFRSDLPNHKSKRRKCGVKFSRKTDLFFSKIFSKPCQEVSGFCPKLKFIRQARGGGQW